MVRKRIRRAPAMILFGFAQDHGQRFPLKSIRATTGGDKKLLSRFCFAKWINCFNTPIIIRATEVLGFDDRRHRQIDGIVPPDDVLAAQ